MFFKNIFQICPEASALFSFSDEPDFENGKTMERHATKVIIALDSAVKALDNPNTL